MKSTNKSKALVIVWTVDEEKELLSWVINQSLTDKPVPIPEKGNVTIRLFEDFVQNHAPTRSLRSVQAKFSDMRKKFLATKALFSGFGNGISFQQDSPSLQAAKLKKCRYFELGEQVWGGEIDFFSCVQIGHASSSSIGKSEGADTTGTVRDGFLKKLGKRKSESLRSLLFHREMIAIEEKRLKLEQEFHALKIEKYDREIKLMEAKAKVEGLKREKELEIVERKVETAKLTMEILKQGSMVRTKIQQRRLTTQSQ